MVFIQIILNSIVVSTDETGISPLVFKNKETRSPRVAIADPPLPLSRGNIKRQHIPTACSKHKQRAPSLPLLLPRRKFKQCDIGAYQNNARLQSLKIQFRSPCSRAAPTSCRCSRGRGGHASPQRPHRPPQTGYRRTQSAAGRAPCPISARAAKKAS
jgi:hypothetical protein